MRGMKLLALIASYCRARNARHQLRSTATTKQLVSSLETNTDRFSTSVERTLDRSREDDRSLEYQFNAHYGRPKYLGAAAVGLGPLIRGGRSRTSSKLVNIDRYPESI